MNKAQKKFNKAYEEVVKSLGLPPSNPRYKKFGDNMTAEEIYEALRAKECQTRKMEKFVEQVFIVLCAVMALGGAVLVWEVIYKILSGG